MMAHPSGVLAPTIVLHEVFKVVLRGDRVVDLDGAIAISAARLAVERRIPTAISLIYATARRYRAELWTQDTHFRGLPHVQLFPKG